MQRYKNSSFLSTILLNESQDVPDQVQVLRVGKFNHPNYGTFEITKQVLSEMKSNFDKRVRGIDVGFDYYHKSDEDASGWPENLELREGGTELWATKVRWTPTAKRKLAERELRYFSPDFTFKWVDPETGETHSNVLFGGGLTNRPFVKEMAAIVADENTERGNTMTDLEKAQAKVKELEAQNVKLSEDKAALETQVKAAAPADEMAALKAEIEKLKAENEALKAKEANALAEKVKSDEAAKLAEKKADFQKLLTEGKVVAAQEEAYLKGDVTAMMKLSQPVNLKGNGTSAGHKDETDEDKILKLAEEKMKADPQLHIGEAISIVKKEMKK